MYTMTRPKKSWKYRVASFDNLAPVLTCRMFIPQIPIPAAMIIMLNMFPAVTLKIIMLHPFIMLFFHLFLYQQ